jgi:aspartate/glutamate racemase
MSEVTDTVVQAEPPNGIVAGEVAPARVRASLEFLRGQGVWHVVSRNSTATSCKDAASRRVRLGATGIPLYDELKSMLCAVQQPAGLPQALLVHCRAHVQLDLLAVQKLLGSEFVPQRVGIAELARFSTAQYGTVNPFSDVQDFVQVFDEGVLDEYTAPHSMMTNLGDLTWAVEFKPADLMRGLRAQGSRVEVGAVTTTRTTDRHQLPSFGIITGNGPDSGMALWEGVNSAVHRRLTTQNRMRGDLSYPRVTIHSLPEMGLSMELAERAVDVWHVIEKALRSMLESGISHVTLACNTTPYFEDEIQALCAPYQAQFVSIVDTLEIAMAKHGVTDATLLAIPRVAAMQGWSAYKRFNGRGLVPVNAGVTEAVQELGYLVKSLDSNRADTRALNKLQHILRSGVSTPWVVVALTEVSTLLTRFPKLRDSIGGCKVLDTLRVLAEAMADVYVRALPDENAVLEDDWL